MVKKKKKIIKALSKRILRKSKTTLKIDEYKAPSVLGDTNRFFKSEWDELRGSL